MVISTKAVANATVDVAFFYTQNALNHTSIERLHKLIEKRTIIANRALSQAGVPLVRKIVAFEPSPIKQNQLGRVAEFLANPESDSHFQDHIKRFGIDYITLLVHQSDKMGCGQAQIGGRLSVVIISDKCNRPSKDYLLAHEWGHLDGAVHTAKERDRAKKRYGVGYVCNGVSTIMNMDTHSANKRFYYSQADSCGKQNVADVARMIKERMKEPGAIQNIEPSMVTVGDVRFKLKTSVVSERHGIQVMVYLNKPLSRPVSVQVFTENISTNNDFAPVSRRIEFPVGISKQRFLIELYDDNWYEMDEHMTVGLRYPQGVKVRSKSQTVTIVSDDGP